MAIWINICAVCGAVTILLVAFCALVLIIDASLYFWRGIDLHLATMLFRRSEKVKACLEVTDYLVRYLDRLGHEPFEDGARIYRDTYVKHHEYTKDPLPDCMKDHTP